MKFLRRLLFFFFTILYSCSAVTTVWGQAACSATNAGTLSVPCAGGTAVSFTLNNQTYCSFPVVAGVQYTIGGALLFSNLYIYDAANLNTPVASSGLLGLLSFSFTAQASGTYRIYNCNTTFLSNYSLTLSVSGGANTLDNPSASGTNVWVGQVYKRSDAAAQPPTATTAFAQYLGYFQVPENFDTGYGGDNTCFLLSSKQLASRISIYTDHFSVKYFNQSTRAPGAYVIGTLGGDDGIRLYVNSMLVFDAWKEETYTAYPNTLIQLTGNSLLEYDYYESSNSNRTVFNSIQRVSNTITTGNITMCAGTVAPSFSATNTLTDAPITGTSGYNVAYQWLKSTDNITFASVTGATGQHYTSADTAVAGTYYYKRVAIITNANYGVSGNISVTAYDTSNTVSLTLWPKPGGVLTGETVCQPDTAALVFTGTSGSGPFSLEINGTIYQDIVSGSPFSVTPLQPPGTTSYLLTLITDNHGCSNP